MNVHRFAVATALATFLLLVIGGLVSTKEAGLACGNDWPTCEGSYFPKLIDGKEIEHSHRLVAMLVGTMTYGLCALLFKYRRRDGLLTKLGVLAAVLVTFQALLGRLTVKMSLPVWVSSTHLSVAMAFLCLTVTLAFLTSASADGAPTAAGRPSGAILLALGLAYAQVAVGAVMRHSRGGLACGFDFPWCLGQVWPADGHFGVQIHMVHRLLGVLVAVAVVWAAARVWRQAAGAQTLKVLAALLVAGVLGQVGLGIATILSSRDILTMTAHSTLGAALLAGLTSLYWVARGSPATAQHPVEASLRPSGSPLEVA